MELELTEHHVHVDSPDSKSACPAPACIQQDTAPEPARATSRLSHAVGLVRKTAADAQQWLGALERPVHPCTLGMYRILYGLALLGHLIHISEALQVRQPCGAGMCTVCIMIQPVCWTAA